MAKAAKKTDTGTTSVELIVVKSKAMSVDVGPRVIAGYSKLTEDDEAARAAVKAVASKRYDLLSDLTLAVTKAALNDDSIDLSVYFGADTKLIGSMNDRIGVALGFRTAKIVGEGDKAKQKIEYSDSVRAYFPMKDDPEDVKQRKRTVASNFSHALKKCSQAAAGIIENDMKIKADKETGTLMISGPAVKKQFGVDTVALNEKQKFEGKKGETITLKNKPSFTAVADMGARAHGAVLKKPEGNHRGGLKNLTPEKMLVDSCKALVSLVSKIKDPNDVQIKAMESAASALNTALGKD